MHAYFSIFRVYVKWVCKTEHLFIMKHSPRQKFEVWDAVDDCIKLKITFS